MSFWGLLLEYIACLIWGEVGHSAFSPSLPRHCVQRQVAERGRTSRLTITAEKRPSLSSACIFSNSLSLYLRTCPPPWGGCLLYCLLAPSCRFSFVLPPRGVPCALAKRGSVCSVTAWTSRVCLEAEQARRPSRPSRKGLFLRQPPTPSHRACCAHAQPEPPLALPARTCGRGLLWCGCWAFPFPRSGPWMGC